MTMNPEGEFEVKALVSEANGEISCSIEETNRVRALLGMKPLKLDSKTAESTALENFRLKRESESKEVRDAEIRYKLEQAKNRRLEKAQLQGGKGLSDVNGSGKGDDDDDLLLSAADWVKRSRVKTVENAEKLRAQKIAEEAATAKAISAGYNATELKGLKVKHSADAFDDLSNIEDGVILTLADSSVVLKDERGRILSTNDAGDELENINMREADLRAARDAKIKRLKKPLYGGYDDDEFEETGEFGGGMVSSEAAKRKGQLPIGSSRVLPQYDLDRQENPNRKKELLVGGDGALMTQSGLHALSNTVSEDPDSVAMRAAHEAELGAQTVSQTLESQKTDIADYYTPAEYSVFNKPKKTKKVKKMRKKERDEGEESSDEFFKQQAELTAVEAGSMDVEALATTTTTSSSSTADRGSRKTLTASATQSGIMAGSYASGSSSSNSMANYYKAIAIAQEKNERTFAQLKSIVPGATDKLSYGVPDIGAVSKMKPNAANIFVTNTVMQELSIGSSAGAGAMDTADDTGEVGEEIDADGRRTDGRLIFNDTTEFTSRLRARLSENARLKAETAVRDQERLESAAALRSSSSRSFAGTVSAGGDISVSGVKRIRAESDGGEEKEEAAADEYDEVAAVGMDLEGGEYELGMMTEHGWVTVTDKDKAAMLEQQQQQQKEEKEEVDEQLSFLHRQPLVSSGMAATLALLKQTNYTAPKEELTGRARDNRRVDPSAPANVPLKDGDRKFDIKLEYRDEKGRKLTQKDAFRQLCYRFHGYGPSEKKLEKRAKEVTNKQKAKTADQSTCGTMQSLTRTQEATGKAHVVIQGGINTGATAAADIAQAIAKSKKLKLNK